MKRLISIMLAVVLVASVCSVTAFAENAHEFQAYEQEFLDYLEENGDYPENFDYGYRYTICYSHFENVADVTPTWVLIYAHTNIFDGSSYGVFDEYVLSSGSGMPYDLGYYFYDVLEDKFYQFHEAWENGLVDMEELLGVNSVDISILGDIDRNKELSIMDATEIQRGLAGITEFQEDYFFRFSSSEYGGEVSHIADIDRDGSVSIFDATAIQRKLAKK